MYIFLFSRKTVKREDMKIEEKGIREEFGSRNSHE